MAIFNRAKQIDQLIQSIGNNKIKIVTGVRRCGKTYLLKNILPGQLKEKGFVKAIGDVLVIELKGKNNNIKTKNQLLNFLNEKRNKNKKFIVIDEVQKIKNYYEILIGYKQENPDKELFLTGSNSKILSSDILLHFQEFGYEIHLSPLTFKEIREVIPNYSVDDYIRYGGLPLIVNELPEKREQELNSIYQELYEGDIKDKSKDKFSYISKSKIRHVLKAIFSTSSEISTKGIAKSFAHGTDATKFDDLKLKAEIEEAIQILIDSYLIIEFENDSFYAPDILKRIGLNIKYYCVDNGLLYINCNDEDRKDGIALENAIYLHLLANKIKPRGKIIWNNKSGKKDGEIDFNYKLNNQEYHIQVTYDYHDGDYDREVLNLQLFNDSSNKILIYRFDSSTKTRDPNIEYIDCETYLSR